MWWSVDEDFSVIVCYVLFGRCSDTRDAELWRTIFGSCRFDGPYLTEGERFTEFSGVGRSVRSESSAGGGCTPEAVGQVTRFYDHVGLDKVDGIVS